MRRVVITGVGVISPIGNNKDEFWAGIKNGVCGIDTVTKFDISEYPCKVAAEVKNFNPEDYIDKKEVRKMDPYCRYATAAATMAILDAKLDMEQEDKNRVGVILGSGVGGIETLETQMQVLLEKGPGRVSPFFIPMLISNIAGAHISILTGAKGLNHTTVSACASGTDAIGEAFRAIRDNNDVDVMFTGGAEATITPLAFAGFCSMKAMSTQENPKDACRPFDIDRDGFVMGEGAGILILEELEHAKSRGADILAEIVGFGSTDDAYHITAPAPDGEGGKRSMELAIGDAKVSPDRIDYINAHGTSTPYNDKFETAAIKAVFGEDAYKIPVSSTKSMTGHLLGASGAIEAIICAMSLNEGYIPQTINYKTPDPDCDLDYVTDGGRNESIEYALSNSLGFGGHNATIILKKY